MQLISCILALLSSTAPSEQHCCIKRDLLIPGTTLRQNCYESNSFSFVSYSGDVLCAGEDSADASLHPDPALVSGCPVGGENEPLLAGSTFCSHPHRPSAHVHDRQGVFRLGDEMRKYPSVCVSFTSTLGCDVILAADVFFVTGDVFVPQLDADDAKVTFEEEPGKDVYDECPLP